MIFLTVGSQLPFDRLAVAMDAWCLANPSVNVFGQIGAPGNQGYRPKNFEWHALVTPSAFHELMTRADVIVAHAGMGSIISALQYQKPIVIMPRVAALGEHRNEHQNATAARFVDRPGVSVSWDEKGLPAAIERATARRAVAGEALSPYAEPSLINAVRRYILTGDAHESAVSMDGNARYNLTQSADGILRRP